MDLCEDLTTLLPLEFVKLDNGVMTTQFFPTVRIVICYFEVTLDLNVSLGSTLGSIEILGQTKLTVSLATNWSVY